MVCAQIVFVISTLTLTLILAFSMELVFCRIRMGVGIYTVGLCVSSMRFAMVRNIIHQDLAFFNDPDCTPAQIIIFSAFVREGSFPIRMVCAQIVVVIGTLTLTLIIAFSMELVFSRIRMVASMHCKVRL